MIYILESQALPRRMSHASAMSHLGGFGELMDNADSIQKAWGLASLHATEKEMSRLDSAREILLESIGLPEHDQAVLVLKRQKADAEKATQREEELLTTEEITRELNRIEYEKFVSDNFRAMDLLGYGNVGPMSFSKATELLQSRMFPVEVDVQMAWQNKTKSTYPDMNSSDPYLANRMLNKARYILMGDMAVMEPKNVEPNHEEKPKKMERKLQPEETEPSSSKKQKVDKRKTDEDDLFARLCAKEEQMFARMNAKEDEMLVRLSAKEAAEEDKMFIRLSVKEAELFARLSAKEVDLFARLSAKEDDVIVKKEDIIAQSSRVHKKNEKIEIDLMKRFFASHFEDNVGSHVLCCDLYKMFLKSNDEVIDENLFAYHSKKLFLTQWTNSKCAHFKNQRCFFDVSFIQ
jgi:hypothetical protein